MKRFFIKPAPGRTVLDPDTMTSLHPEGEEKPFTPFWCRRLDDGDVIEVDLTAVPENTPTKKTSVSARMTDEKTDDQF